MPGAIAANLHEGNRSEYLAQYIFASFGTAIPVPHPEDTGIDLYCTITERVGNLAWPRFYFSVQVKSSSDPWTFPSKESVRWLIEYPLPIFLCIVDKSSARIRLYHTSPRFYVWAMPPLPSELRLVPTMESEGQCTGWKNGTEFSLSAPILDASVQELLEDDFHRKASEVLRFWIGVDLANLQNIRAHIHSFTMPHKYSTNGKGHGGWVKQEITQAPEIHPALDRVKEPLAWISSQLYRGGDLAGAIRCALFLRYFFKDDFAVHDPHLHLAINHLTGHNSEYTYSGVDKLNALVDEKLAGGIDDKR
jgi:hypothetical protein